MTEAVAALRGTTIKESVVRVIEREVDGTASAGAGAQSGALKLPLIQLRDRQKLDLADFDFDNLLA